MAQRWHKEDYEKLEQIWTECKKDREEFRKRVEGDEYLMSKYNNYSAIEQKCYRGGLFEGKKEKRFWFVGLSSERQEEIKKDYADDNVSWASIKEKIAGWGIEIKESVLQIHAGKLDIKVNKAATQRENKKEESVAKEDAAGQSAKDPRDKKLKELFEQGKLAGLNADGMLDAFNKEFPDNQLNVEELKEKLDEIVWTPKVNAELEKALQHNISLKKFHEYHKDIPNFSMIEERAQWIAGTSGVGKSAEFVFGLGRIASDAVLENLGEYKDYEFPNITFGKPFEIPVKNPNNWGGISILNAPLIGLKHDRVIKRNPARRILAEAERRKDEAVIIVNPIDINTKKSHGSARIHRAIVSGRNVNIKVLDPDYQENAKAILDGEREGTLIYETYAEVLANIIAGWHKITHRPERLGGGPEYTGKVFVQFGYNEEEFIMAAASWDERYKTIQEQKRLDAEIVMAKSAKKRAEKSGDDEEIRFWSKELDKLVKERARTIISNISNEPTAKTVRKMRAFVVKMFEETIPNCTVIGQGSLYIKAGNKMIELNIPGHLNITDSLLSNYADNYGPNVLRGKFADIVVVCHPYSLGFRSTGREADRDGRRNSSEVFVAPAALDGAFLRDQLRASIRKVHPISKLIFNHQFSPGYMRIVCANGIVSGDFTSIDAIGAYKKYVNKEKLSENKNLVNYEDCQFIWAFNASDPHWGSRAKEYIWDKENQKYLGVCEAAIEMMRRAGLFKGGRMPVHMFNICDDPTQGNHYGTEKQPDINQMSYMLIENRWKEAVQKARARGVSTKDQLAILEEMRRLSLTQLHARGLDWLQHQIIEMLERHVAANVDFYDALLSRAFKAGIKAVGASYYRHEDFNTCDIGLINFGTGNHLAGTVDKTLTEGFLYADKARTELRALPRWRKEEKLLKELVQYPVHGNVAIGWGTIQAGKGYLWTIELRDSPTRLSSWGDTLQGWVRNDIKRANYSRFFDKGKTVKITGDKHFVGSVDTDWAFYHMCPAGTHTDTYGERGFPPNNTGVSFVGMPVNGPASGPMLVRTLRYDFLVKYFEKPFDFNWEKFLPNPA